jgi:photosystem II stability/assembly factor-like uncharacterized protein
MGLRCSATASLVAVALACALFATLGRASVNVAQSGWSWGSPTPQGNTLNSIDFVQGRGFAAGDAGTVLRTDDGGTTWTGLATGTSADLTRLQVLDPDTLMVLGGDGCVLRRSDDAGATFRKVFIIVEQNCAGQIDAFTFVDRQTGYLLIRGGNVYRTTDGGQTFSRQTAVPGTESSNNPSGNRAVDIAFTSADNGIVFVQPPNGGAAIAFSTTDAGNSWKPIDAVAPGTVRRVGFLDSQNGFAVGPSTLLATTDGGKVWKSRAGAANQDLTSIRCSDVNTCLMTTAKGDKLLRTTDGGETVTEITPSSQAIFAAAFNSATRVAAVGAAGTTVLSDDGGVNYTPISKNLDEPVYTRLRPGPDAMTVWAVGRGNGQLAYSKDGGATWNQDGVPTSRNMVDVSFASATTGFALDEAGGLFKTVNSGGTWQTLDTGQTAAPNALSAPSPDTVVLVGPRGIRRGQGASQPQPVGGATVAKSSLNQIVPHPNLLIAYGNSGKLIFLSTDGGQKWKTIRLPKKVRIGFEPNSADFVSARVGFFLDTQTRLWKTVNGGRTWAQVLGLGTSAARGISMADAANGVIPVHGIGGRIDDPTATAQVLRTSDGGKTWRLQAIARGLMADAIATGPQRAYALVGGNHFFFTASGGDAGNPTTLALRTTKRSFTKKAFKKARGRVTVSGTLPGAVGGEQIVVSRRDLRGTRWVQQIVTAGANGGSFTTSWRIRASSVFVAQWAGDSGRRGAGSTPLAISVQR